MLIDYKENFIDKANNKVPIEEVLKLAGVEITGRSKLLCPWTMLHSDSKPAFKVFATTNTGRCFSCQKSYSPVSLAAQVWDCSFKAAAIRLLDTIEEAPKTLRERWEFLDQPEEIQIDKDSLAEALRIYCSRIDEDWTANRFELSSELNKCFSLLDSVRSWEDVTLWLSGSKQYMARAIERKMNVVPN